MRQRDEDGAVSLPAAAQQLTDAVRGAGHEFKVEHIVKFIRSGSLTPATVTRASLDQLLAVFRRNASRQRVEHHSFHDRRDD